MTAIPFEVHAAVNKFLAEWYEEHPELDETKAWKQARQQGEALVRMMKTWKPAHQEKAAA